MRYVISDLFGDTGPATISGDEIYIGVSYIYKSEFRIFALEDGTPRRIVSASLPRGFLKLCAFEDRLFLLVKFDPQIGHACIIELNARTGRALQRRVVKAEGDVRGLSSACDMCMVAGRLVVNKTSNVRPVEEVLMFQAFHL
jgi:hypothetical protein